VLAAGVAPNEDEDNLLGGTAKTLTFVTCARQRRRTGETGCPASSSFMRAGTSSAQRVYPNQHRPLCSSQYQSSRSRGCVGS